MNTERIMSQHPLLASIAESSRWLGKDQFPSVARRDDVIKWLEYLDGKSQFPRYLPRLKDTPAKRDEALAEIYAAYFIEKYAGYPITAWEPPGNNGKQGEFSFGFDGKGIFCEVKSPGWEREIVEREGVNSLRLNQPKYIRGEGGSFDNSSYVQDTVLKAYPKFPINQSTLLILVDDFKVPLSDDPIDMWKALFKENVGCFTTNQFCNLGAIGVLCMEKIDPDFCVYHNPMALESVIVPKEVFTKYKQVSD